VSLIVRMCMGDDHSSPGIESQGHRSRSKVSAKMCSLRVSTTAPYEYWLMAVVGGSHCDVISCQLARRGVRRGVPDASYSGTVQHVRVVTRSVWPRSSTNGSYSLVFVKCKRKSYRLHPKSDVEISEWDLHACNYEQNALVHATYDTCTLSRRTRAT